MAVVESNMLPLGSQASDFSLPDTNNKICSLKDFSSSPLLLIMFISNHCPYVKHIKTKLAKFGKEYEKKGVAFIAINANDVERHPEDNPENMRLEKEKYAYPFPYLFDESQEVAKSYQAACTPDFFLFNQERRLIYRGQLDSSRPGNNTPVTGEDMRRALDLGLVGKQVPETEQKSSAGCNIKWKPGNEPS